MTLRTAEQYKEGLRDGRNVYILGNKVEDVTEDPYIKVGVETGAFDFLMGHDPAFQEMAVMKDPESGEDISTYFEVPDYPESVGKRFELVKTASEYAGAALPFVKDVGTDLERVKWYLWHGNVFRALQVLGDVQMDLDSIEDENPAVDKLYRAVSEFITYIANNKAFIPNYGDRYRYGEMISTAFAESTVNQVVSKRMVKKQQMRWT